MDITIYVRIINLCENNQIYLLSLPKMKIFDKPNNDIVVDSKGFYPYSSYLYIFNLITMYKAEVLTRNRLQELLECPNWVLDNVDYNIKDIESAVFAVITWDIDK